MIRIPIRIPILLAACLLFAGCATRAPAPAEEAPAAPAVVIPPIVTRGEFTLEADKLDTWNALGQIVVNTPGLDYQGRSQIMDLYTVRYRGEEFLLLTRAVVLTETIRRTTTRVTATTRDGKPIDSDAVADLLAQVQAKLPAAIVEVRAKQAAEAKAKQSAKAKAAKSKKQRR